MEKNARIIRIGFWDFEITYFIVQLEVNIKHILRFRNQVEIKKVDHKRSTYIFDALFYYYGITIISKSCVVVLAADI